ncbi:MAG TPA: hypothetical protein VF773_16730 [Verrucomicrobiae bacterium]
MLQIPGGIVITRPVGGVDNGSMWLRIAIAFLAMCETIGALGGAGSMAHKSSNVTYFPAYEGWQTHFLVVIALAEVFGIYCVYKLWRRRDYESVVVKVFSSLVLLVPVVGPVFYYFVKMEPAPNYGK